MKWFKISAFPARLLRPARLASDPPRMSDADRRAMRCRIEQLAHDPEGGFGVPINYTPRY